MSSSSYESKEKSNQSKTPSYSSNKDADHKHILTNIPEQERAIYGDELDKGDYDKIDTDKIKFLEISRRNLKEFPQKNVEVFSNLVHLVIEHYCHLENISKENLKEFPKLEKIDLYGNNLKKIPKDLFEFNKKLKFIDLSRNDIQIIEPGTLAGLYDLEEFFMKYNCIEFLPGSLFDFNKKLKEISFSGNKIKFIGPELLDGHKSLKLVDFDECSCINLCYGNTYNRPHPPRPPRKSTGTKPYVRHVNKARSLEEIIEKIKSLEMPMEFIQAIQRSVVEKQNLINFVAKNEDEEVQNCTPPRTQDFDKLLARDDLKDFTIKIDSREFKVHKFVLIVRSEYFAELLKNNPDMIEFELDDISAEFFEIILKFLYTDKIPKDHKNVRDIFEAAGKYKIGSLKEMSAYILLENLWEPSLKELWEIFNLGEKFDHEEMKLKVFEKIKENFSNESFDENLINHPEMLKEIVEAKIKLDQLLSVKVENSVRKTRKRKIYD